MYSWPAHSLIVACTHQSVEVKPVITNVADLSGVFEIKGRVDEEELSDSRACVVMEYAATTRIAMRFIGVACVARAHMVTHLHSFCLRNVCKPSVEVKPVMTNVADVAYQSLHISYGILVMAY